MSADASCTICGGTGDVSARCHCTLATNRALGKYVLELRRDADRCELILAEHRGVDLHHDGLLRGEAKYKRKVADRLEQMLAVGEVYEAS